MGRHPARLDALVFEKPPDESAVAVVTDTRRDCGSDTEPGKAGSDVAGEATDESLERPRVLEGDADLLRVEIGMEPADDDRLETVIGAHGAPVSQARGLETVIWSIA
jgi:hypothetical protein